MEKIEAQKRFAAIEAYEAETAKREAEELSKLEELEIIERIGRKMTLSMKNMTLSVRKSKQQKSNVRKSAKRKSCNVRKIAKRLKGTINYFVIWKRQNWQ